ncbi:MAG: hypothetical protein KKC80_05605 [Candidatus Margulisbacteria bacterium]|nr:hypothetical protein [Candidatus Margulisiibacteriota bacterium]
MEKENTGEKIVLLEFTDEAEAFLEYCREQALSPMDFRIIALQAQVQLFFKSCNIPFENTLPYLSNQAHSRALLQSEKWYQFLAKNISLEDGTEIKESYNDTFLFFLRFYMHHFLMYNEMLVELTNKHNIASIYACSPRNDIQENSTPQIQAGERYVGAIAKIFSSKHDLKFKKIPMRSSSSDKKRSFGGFISAFFLGLAAEGYRRLLCFSLKRKKVVLLASSGYNVGKIANDLKRNYSDVHWMVVSEEIGFKKIAAITLTCVLRLLNISRISGLNLILPIKPDIVSRRLSSGNGQRLARSVDDLIAKLNGDWHGHFTVNGVNFMDIMGEKIVIDLKPYLVNLYYKSVIMKRCFDTLNIKLMISPFARFTYFMLAELCLIRDIPALMIAHGPIVAPKNELESIENYHLGKTLVLSDVYNCAAIQTPTEFEHYEYYRKHHLVKEKRIIKTGPLVFAKINVDQKAALKKKYLDENIWNKKIILYPESVRLRNGMRFHTFQTFDEFLASAADLISAINEIEGYHLVIRLHAGWGRSSTFGTLRSLLPKTNNLPILSSDPPFYEMLTLADLLVNFSSTVIEEALQNFIPVLLFDREGRYQHLEAEKLTSGTAGKIGSVYYVNDAKHLKDGLQWLLDNILSQNVPKPLFKKYLFAEDYSGNLSKFVSEKVGQG